MEFKHFSHKHGLIFHQMSQGTKIHCSGCKLPGLENTYVCWQCNYFLHEQCFRASRSLKHPSHPHHPLTLAPFPTYSSGSFICKHCSLEGKGFSYGCSECEFDIHVLCAHVQNTISRPQTPTYPHHIQNNSYLPHHNPTIPNDRQSYPPPPQPQVTSFPPNPNNPYPNSAPPNTMTPNQTQNYASHQTYPPNHQNNHHVHPFPQPNPNFVNVPQPNPNLPPPDMRNPTQTQNYTSPQTYPSNKNNPNPGFSQPNPNFVNVSHPNPNFPHPNTINPTQTQTYSSPQTYPPNQNNNATSFSHPNPSFANVPQPNPNSSAANKTNQSETQNYTNPPAYLSNQHNYVPNFSHPNQNFANVPQSNPNLSSPDTTNLTQTQNYTSPQTHPPAKNDPIPTYAQPNPNFANVSHSNPNTTTPNRTDSHNIPPTNTYPPNQNNLVRAASPNLSPRNTTIPNQTQDYTIPPTNTYPPSQNNQSYTFQQPNPNSAKSLDPNAPTLSPAQQTYSTPVQYPHPDNSQSQATPIVMHFSHPHAMKATETDQNNEIFCSACESEITGYAYCCTEPYCRFNLHKTCFDSPMQIRHKSHNQHPLTLHPAASYGDGFTCNACDKHGNSFVYNCATCSYDLHIECAQLPEIVTRPDHKHNLILNYSETADEDVTFTCDVCNIDVRKTAWIYYCRECDFGTHLECVKSEALTEEELVRKLHEVRLQGRIQAESQQAMLDLWDTDEEIKKKKKSGY